MIKLNELLDVQNEFAETLSVKPTKSQYALALNIEISEFLNTLPWKWWKKQQTVNKEKTLDELADILAFWLSWYNLYLRDIKSNNALYDATKYQEDVQLLEFNINYGIGKEQNSVPKLELIEYETVATLSHLTASARRLGRLIYTAMYYTNATPLEIVAAYKKKMNVNYDRQKTNY